MSIMLLPKILGCVWILCLLSPEIHGQCSKPDLSDNVVLVGATFEEGSSEKLSCVPGYAPLTGPPRVTCQGGKWNPNPQDFTCKKKSCGNPGDLRNGGYDTTGGIDFGSTVTAICNEGYQLFGESKRSCLADGTWDGQEPRCEAVKCGRPPSIENGGPGSAPEEQYDHGSVVRYVCNDDYTLFGERDSICKNGDWTEAPRCKKVQCTRPVIPNAKRVQGGSGPYGYKDTLTYECNKGFEMVSGEARIVCEENGWSSTPKCEAVQPAKTTPRTPVKETTTSKVIQSSAKTTPRVSTKATTTSEDLLGQKDSAHRAHSSLWIVLAVVLAGMAAQNGQFSLIQ
ncbi:zona pellucida sperm-binding protein 3 receptor-like isoform X1 [Clupea harengus]|uniref:Zona pellucida sperm-binding protein 3 receptor-like isoform X1 n=1 Tax=Clupea harengus TaxID=7950 RepID=A0A6P8F9F4_CLUHA|nr:zona pellucida sperm-binding protein 3 receptor-like isoform X1 [Clupea harengus]XP_031421910.1 zona pellucida sperm-binding protein 3 receptor-like isoform X1 [Clupea harengus]